MTAYADFLREMPRFQREQWMLAEQEIVQPSYEAPRTARVEIGGISTAEIVDGGLCTKWIVPGAQRCFRSAGSGTDHDGVGWCYRHGGNSRVGRIRGATEMAYAYSDELNVSPWDALLSQVRLLAGQVNYLHHMVGFHEQQDPKSILPGGEFYFYTELLEQRGNRMAKVAKMAIDAGVAERMVRQVELDGQLMFQAASNMLDTIGMPEAEKIRALSIMGTNLLALESTTTLEGKLV